LLWQRQTAIVRGEYFGECANLDVVYNERIKLFATFLNGIGVAVFAVEALHR